MKWLFIRSALLPDSTEQRMALLWGTIRIFVSFVAVFFAVYGCYWLLAEYSKLGSFHFDVLFVVCWVSLPISLPWLVAALVAAVYVNHDLLPHYSAA
ncbi:hypothetical protein H8B15_06855 [Hymenobacter sp. BT507]|uniref:Uncharacterized protein n=1 Tax=Hymenobacter citatus TaxID=2763506 RepID=A0ABR7MIF4_9BACT|nr:hypothetical protein [Hymenobacter citatus]MBC6610634.1 hypothetical protein [Hymenobacter citatus]